MYGRLCAVAVALVTVSVTGGCRAITGRPHYNNWQAYRPLPRSNDAHLELALERLDSLNRFQRRKALRDIARLLCGGDPAQYRPSLAVPGVSPAVREQLGVELAKAVDDIDAQVRRQACFTLAVLGNPHAKIAVPELIRATADPDLKVARQASFALGRLGVGDDEVVQALTDQLVKPGSELRKTLVELHGPAKEKALKFYAAVSLFAVLGKARLPITGKLAKDGTGDDAGGRAEPLGQLIPRLAGGLLHHHDWRARRAAAMALGELGDKRSYVTLESLRRASNDSDKRVREAAVEARAKILKGSNGDRKF